MTFTGDSDLESAYRDVRVIVLGASGFLGRWVARALGALGADVYVVVRHLQPARSVFERYGVTAQTVELDLTEARATREMVRELRPSVVFNLCGYGVDPAERDEAMAYAINAELVENVCNALGSESRPKWSGLDFVHAGSALEYGGAGGILWEDTPPRPTTAYGKSKLAGTHLLANTCEQHGLAGVTARLFTVYGPGEHAGRLLPSLLATAATGAPLRLTAGLQRRDFTYVEDAVEGLLRLGHARPRPGEVVNLATGRLTPVRTFAELAAEILHISPDRLEFGALATRGEEMQHTGVSTARLQRLIGWLPSQGIEMGIRKTAEFVALGSRVAVDLGSRNSFSTGA